MKTPLDISLHDLADAAKAAGREADAEARVAGIEPAGLVALPKEPRPGAMAHKRVSRATGGGGSARERAARRGLGG